MDQENLKIYTLPQDLEVDAQQRLALVDYHNPAHTMRAKVNLGHHVFSFLQTGFKEVEAAQSPVSIDQSHFLIMKAGHSLMTEKLPAPGHPYRSILFFFSDEVLEEFVERHAHDLGAGEDLRSILACPYDDFLESFVRSLISISRLPDTAQAKILETKFEEVMLYMLHRRGAAFLQALLPDQDRNLRHLVQVVESNALNKLSLKELAFLSHMSVSTFKREFEKHFHSPPMRWFQEKRLDHAAYLLKNRSKRPKEIYLDVGYESLSSFTKAFRLKFGTTPKQYQLQS